MYEYILIYFEDLKSVLIVENVFFITVIIDDVTKNHCVKRVHIWSYSGPHFPAFGLNTERYGVSLRILSECGKMRTRITPNTDTFHAGVNKSENLFIMNNELYLF